jgi:hypothetical protein
VIGLLHPTRSSGDAELVEMIEEQSSRLFGITPREVEGELDQR